MPCEWGTDPRDGMPAILVLKDVRLPGTHGAAPTFVHVFAHLRHASHISPCQASTKLERERRRVPKFGALRSSFHPPSSRVPSLQRKARTGSRSECRRCSREFTRSLSWTHGCRVVWRQPKNLNGCEPRASSWSALSCRSLADASLSSRLVTY